MLNNSIRMWRALFLLLVLFVPGYLSIGYHRRLGFLIPSDRLHLPKNVTTGIYGLSLPDLEKIPSPIENNIILLNRVFKGNIFDQAYETQLHPMYNLRLQAKISIETIQKYLAKLKELLKDQRIGTDEKRTDTFPLNMSTLFLSLKFNSIGTLTSGLRKVNTFSEPEGSGDGDVEAYKIDPKFQKAVGFLMNLNQDLKMFALRFKSFVNTLQHLKSSNIEQLRQEFFFKDFLETSIGKEIDLIDVTYFYKTLNKLEVNLNLATFSELTEFIKYSNIQYFDRKLSETYFSMPDSDDYFLLSCITPTVCIPSPTSCSRALKNESTYTILSKCHFEISTADYDVIPSIGIVVNKETDNKEIKKILTDQEVEPSTYPFLLQFHGCLELNKGKLRVCFTNEKAVIYSYFTNDIWKLINPLWYNSLLGYIKDFPLWIYVTFSILFYALVTLGCITVKGRIEKYTKDKKDSKKKGKSSQKLQEDTEDHSKKPKKPKTSSSRKTEIAKEETELRNLFSKKE